MSINWIWMKSIARNGLLPSAHFEEALNKPLYHMGHSHTVGLVKEINYFEGLNEIDWMLDTDTDRMNQLR